MIKVALITSWEEKCGIAEYAANLVSNCNKDIAFDLVDRHWSIQHAIDIIRSSNIVCLNYEPGILGHWNEGLIRSLGKKSVLILHTSQEGINRSNFTDAFTKVVVHESVADSGNFILIPMGIPKVKLKYPSDKPIAHFDVGSVGFPFPWKGFTQVVEACNKINKSCLIIIPESRHADAHAMKRHLLSLHNKVTVLTDWFDQNETLTVLSGCRILAFPFHGGNYGISASCRLGLGTGNQVLLSRSRMFRDLFEYEDEIEFVDQPPTCDNVAEGLLNLWENPMKRPKRVIQDMNWKRVGEMYSNLFEELI